MYTKWHSSSNTMTDINRLAGDPIDTFGMLGTNTAENPFHSSGYGYLTTGNVEENAICTGNAETDAWDRNQGTTYKCYVNNFQNKGFLQFQLDLEGTSLTTGYSWGRRENIYASTHVLKADTTTITPGYAELTVSQTDVLLQSETIPKNGTGHELFVLFQYGRQLHFGDPSDFVSGGNGTKNCNAAVGTIEVDGNKVKFNRVQSHPAMVVAPSEGSGTKWEGTHLRAVHSGANKGGDGTGGDLTLILKEENMPRVMIGPYRKWIIMQMGIGPAANSDADKETWENYESRGYGSLCAVKRPEAAGGDLTNGGFALGTTFNESKFFVNSSDQSPYYNRRSFDIEEDTVPYEKEVDFGMGAYDAEAGTGGMITNHRPDYGFNRLNLDAILDGTDYGTRHGDPLAFTMVASGGGAGDTNALYMYSSNITGSNGGELYYKPRLITKFKDDPPLRPGLVVNPNEEDASIPEFSLALDGDDLWHGFIMVSDKPITSKYDNLMVYAPLDENLDVWKRAGTTDLAVTPKQIKCYNHIDFLNKEELDPAVAVTAIREIFLCN